MSKIDPSRLKSKDGCEEILKALGMQWGRFQNEDRYVKFERALFLTTQKPDESNDSYIARHEACFEEILQKDKGVTLEEIRAYVMIRHSQLTGDEKKKIIVDNKGELTYEATRNSMRLLGSKFFQDLQGGGGKKYKTYDVHTVNESEPVFAAIDEVVDEEQAFQVMLEQGDEDAIFIQEFEDQIIEAVQESGDLSSCFMSYQDARARLRERARHRGFWPSRAPGKGKGFNGGGKKGGKGSGGYPPRRTLAERIANSTCRICNKPGHWKRECPQRQDRPDRQVDMATMAEEMSEQNPPELPEDLPFEIQEPIENHFVQHFPCYAQDRGSDDLVKPVIDGEAFREECFVSLEELGFREKLTRALNHSARHHDECSVRRPAGTHEATSLSQSFSVHQTSHVSAKDGHEESSEEAILDTGASRTIIGSERVPQLERALKGIEIQRGPSRCVFRFGNSGLLHSEEALFLKRHGKGWLRVEIVPGSTPFLISNAVIEGMKGILDVHMGCLSFHGSDDMLRLRQVRRKLNCVNIRDLLNIRFHDGTGENCLHTEVETNKQDSPQPPPQDVHVEFVKEPNHDERQTSLLQTTDLQQPALSQSLPARQWKVDFIIFSFRSSFRSSFLLQNIFALFSFILGLSFFLRHVHPSRTGWLCCHFYGLPKSLQSQSAPQTMYKCVKGFPHPSLPEQSKPRIKIMECNLQAAELNHWAPKA